MYIPIGKIVCVKGKIFDDTLLIEVDDDTTLKLPIKQKIQTTKSGFIQFIRDGNGVCKILRIVEI